MTNPYLFLDVEAGGLDPRTHSLLSLGLVVGDASGVANSLEILIKHEPFVVSAAGMRVNRIDLVKHAEAALAPDLALAVLDVFLDQHFPHRCQPIILVGQNVAYDRSFLAAFLERHGRPLEPRFSHRTVDTHSVALALREAGRLPLADLGLSTLLDHFGIEVPQEARHTALGDSLATFQLYWKLVELMR